MLDDILKQAEMVASEQSPDDAARFLAPHRKSACEDLSTDTSRIGDLLCITSAQMQYLIDAGASDKAIGVAEWFLHILHHLEESLADVDFRQLKRALRESFSRFFKRYAHALRDINRYEDMRIAMRTSLDLTMQLPLAIVSMLHLYAPLHQKDLIENESARDFLLKRYAEALAALDFSGLHDLPFRAALDEYQYAFRSEEHVESSRQIIQTLCEKNPEDLALVTLKNIFETIFEGRET